jgi:hypothetical protein
VLSYARRAFPPVLTDKLNSFRTELLAAHGSVAAEAAAAAGISPSASGTSTPTSAAGGSSSSAPAPAPAKAATPAPAPKEEKKKVGGTAVVQAEANLQASADDIWGLLTDQNRIPMWSRSPAKVGQIRLSRYFFESHIFFSLRRPLLQLDPSALSPVPLHFKLQLQPQFELCISVKPRRTISPSTSERSHWPLHLPVLWLPSIAPLTLHPLADGSPAWIRL